MSPLLFVLLKALRIASLVMAALMLVFLGLAVWQKAGAQGFGAVTRQDYSFFTVLALLALAALWMWRAIGRELQKSGS